METNCFICRVTDSVGFWKCCPEHCPMDSTKVVCASCYALLHPEHKEVQESRPQSPSIQDIVSPDAPTTTNEQGGSQSDIPVRFDLIDAKAMFEMAKVLDHGARKYGEDNWRLIPVEEHLNHALMHIYGYLAGDRTEDHLSHILCRATFAQGVDLQTQEDVDKVLAQKTPMKGRTD